MNTQNNQSNQFLSPDYQIPQPPSNYMKFKKGSNRFRILSHAITGYEYWSKENKPIRQRQPFDVIPLDIKLNNDGTYSQIKHFWAFVVYNYQEKVVQILEITQASIQGAMKIKIDNRQGDAMGYDFIVTRTGEGFDTDYDTDVGNPEPVSSDVMSDLAAKKINLEALFDGTDPFSSVKSSPEAQNQRAGRDNWNKVGNSLQNKSHPTQRQTEADNETVAPDIAETARQMENGEIDVSGIPF